MFVFVFKSGKHYYLISGYIFLNNSFCRSSALANFKLFYIKVKKVFFDLRPFPEPVGKVARQTLAALYELRNDQGQHRRTRECLRVLYLQHVSYGLLVLLALSVALICCGSVHRLSGHRSSSFFSLAVLVPF